MKPFEATLKKYLDIFFNQEMYFENDIRCLELFKNNPGNSSAADVQMKISAVNDKEVWSLGLTDDMVAHVVALNIDARLQRGDLAVVNDVGHLNAQGKSFTLLHFASVYCNFHRPDAFPIYSDQHMAFYRKYIAERNLPINPDELHRYEVFSRALNHVVEHIHLKGKMNYLQLRKFAWLYAESVLKESAVP